MLTTSQLARVLPRPRRRAGRVGPGAGALPLLDQHVPVVAPGPPVPATSPTTARSTPSRATATGCGPARRCSPPSLLPGDLERIFPICSPDGQRLGHLRRGARAAAHGRLRAAPRRADDDPRGVGAPATRCPRRKRDFYRYHASLMEPWDGPASIAFTDGTVIGAVLDRNGLRPSRYWVTDDDLVIMASEVGVLDVDPAKVVQKGRLQPGPHVPGRHHRRVASSTTRRSRATWPTAHPYGEWLGRAPGRPRRPARPARHDARPRTAPWSSRQQMFGYTTEEIKILLEPMARTGAEPIGSMGTDTPIAVLSDRPRLLFDYFYAAVRPGHQPAARRHPRGAGHRPGRHHRPRGQPARTRSPSSCRQLVPAAPDLDNDELAKLRPHRRLRRHAATSAPSSSRACTRSRGRRRACARRSTTSAARPATAIDDGATILVLSDRDGDRRAGAHPVAAVHRRGAPPPDPREDPHPGRARRRDRRGPRGAPHVPPARATAPPPSTPTWPSRRSRTASPRGRAELPRPHQGRHATTSRRPARACSRSCPRWASPRSRPTPAPRSSRPSAWPGAGRRVLHRHGQPPRRHRPRRARRGGRRAATAMAYPANPTERAHRTLEVGGEYQWRREGEYHLFNPETVFKLQHATRTGRYDVFKEYTSRVDDQAAPARHPAGPVPSCAPASARRCPLDEVEPVSEIVKRFSTGAMSYGSISAEAHETLAIAMNRLGGKSNTGEGGEDPEPLRARCPTATRKRSAIKQVASGRFGVTSEYLVNADDIQIKMAQGAKPGEGGQLPGHKVYPWIAKTRHSTPGVGLISPPPHHDIYSIEDLAQLIHDLKNANPGPGPREAGRRGRRGHRRRRRLQGPRRRRAHLRPRRRHRRLAAHLAQARRRPVGARAWPRPSRRCCSTSLRDRIVVQVDGQLKTGRDVVIAALLGAEEFGFATAPLVVSGCVMMRVCHLDTCPVGIATQNPELRKRFTGKPEFVVNFFEYIAEEVRELLAELGFRTLDEAIGHAELLDARDGGRPLEGRRARPHARSCTCPSCPRAPAGARSPARTTASSRRSTTSSSPGPRRALERGRAGHASTCRSATCNRTVGTMLGAELTRRHGGEGLPDDTIVVDFTGSAGQSFGAFLPRGITLRLDGDANDYVGKGLSGGRIIVRPPTELALRGRGQHHRRQRDPLRRHRRRGVPPGRGGRALLRAQLRRRGRGRGRGRPRLRVHDRRPGRRARRRPGATSAPACRGGIAYVLDPDGTLPRAGQPRDGRPRGPRRRRRGVAARPRRAPPGRDRLDAWPQRLLDDWDDDGRPRSVKVMPKDYKRVLEAEREADAEGRDPVEAVMAAARAEPANRHEGRRRRWVTPPGS